MKRITWLFIAIIAVVVLWSGAWLFLSGEVRKNIAALADADGLTTPRFTCETLDVSGFPFRFDADCGNGRLVDGDITVDVAGLRASVLVYRPTHVVASALAPISIADAFTGSRSAVTFAALAASARLDGWRIARVSVSGQDVHWSDMLMGEQLIARGALVDLQLGDIPDQHDPDRGLAALAGYLQARDLVIPGFTIADGGAEIEVEVTGLPDDVRLLGEPDALVQWRAAGGQIKLVSAHATDGDSTLKASGELALDPQGLLDGQIAVASTQVAERLGPYIAEPYRTMVVGNPAADGSHANVLSFRAGTIFSGLIPIGAVPPLF